MRKVLGSHLEVNRYDEVGGGGREREGREGGVSTLCSKLTKFLYLFVNFKQQKHVQQLLHK